MSEQLIKLPVRYDVGIFSDRDGERILALSRWSQTAPSHAKELGEYIAKALNDHTALLAVAEAAEAFNRDQSIPRQNALTAALAAWRAK